MPVTLQDRQDILDLMTGWMYRDLANWEGLAQLFHPDGSIEVTWFEGLAKDFIEGSIKMGKSDFHSKHFIGQPIIRFNVQKAIAETNAMIIVENVAIGLGCVTHNRFYDLVEKRNGAWKILTRQTIYDTGHFTFPVGMVEIDRNVLGKHPHEYAALAYLLEKSGFSVKRVFATKASQLEKEMKQEGEAWLSGHPLGDVQMRYLKLTKVVAIIEPVGQQRAVARLRTCADSEFVNPDEPHRESEVDD